jgi:hypothetical protein
MSMNVQRERQKRGKHDAMKIIKIVPTKRCGRAWCAEEAPCVSPCYTEPNGKQSAIDYARKCRFGRASGGIHVYDDAGEKVVETIPVKGRGACLGFETKPLGLRPKSG